MKWLRKNVAVFMPRILALAMGFLTAGEIETIARHVSEWTGRNPSHPLKVFSRALAEKATNIPNKFAENGEQALLDRIASLPFRVLVDVGANVGTWSRYAIKTFPSAELHAFEIVPDTFEILRQNLPAAPELYLNRFGLSNEEGTVGVHVYSSNLISSMFALSTDRESQTILDCEVQRGADYFIKHGIGAIDALKIDVEGAEGRVLEGLEPMISEGRIRLIQFEYNRGSILGKFLLKDAYDFFTPRGYRLGKLTPEGVVFHEYHFGHEDFVGPNYIACRRVDDELVRCLEA